MISERNVSYNFEVVVGSMHVTIHVYWMKFIAIYWKSYIRTYTSLICVSLGKKGYMQLLCWHVEEEIEMTTRRKINLWAYMKFTLFRTSSYKYLFSQLITLPQEKYICEHIMSYCPDEVRLAHVGLLTSNTTRTSLCLCWRDIYHTTMKDVRELDGFMWE